MPKVTRSGEASKERLVEALERTLGISMGIRIIPGTTHRPPQPDRVGPALAYWLQRGFGGHAAVLPPASEGHRQIVSLLAWFGLSFAAGLYVALSTNRKVFDTVTNDIIPHATDEYLDAVASDLDRNFTTWHLIWLPLLAAAAAVAATTWMLTRDVEVSIRIVSPYPWELLFWLASYLLCFYTAAAGVIAGQFHFFFARNLPKASRSFYVLRR